MSDRDDRAKLRGLLRKVWATRGECAWVRLVDTQSMSPSLPGNVTLLVEWLDTPAVPAIPRGDLILVSLPPQNLMVAHRLCAHKEQDEEFHILQIADARPDGQVDGSWVPAQSVFGRIVALQWGKAERRTRHLTGRPYRLTGRLLAALATIQWEECRRREERVAGRARRPATAGLHRVGLRLLHWLLTYLYALLLRLGPAAPPQHEPEIAVAYESEQSSLSN